MVMSACIAAVLTGWIVTSSIASKSPFRSKIKNCLNRYIKMGYLTICKTMSKLGRLMAMVFGSKSNQLLTKRRILLKTIYYG